MDHLFGIGKKTENDIFFKSYIQMNTFLFYLIGIVSAKQTCVDIKHEYTKQECCLNSSNTFDASFAYPDRVKEWIQYHNVDYEELIDLYPLLEHAESTTDDDEKTRAYDHISIVHAYWRACYRNPTNAEIQDHLSKFESGEHANQFEMTARVWQSPCSRSIHHPSFEEGSLEGKIVVITGGSTGMGFAAAIYMARLGATVVCIARSQQYWDWNIESARVGAKESDRYPYYFGPIDIESNIIDRITFETGDVRDKNGLRSIFEHISDTRGPIDVLIANAGINVANIVQFPAVETDLTKLARFRHDEMPEDIYLTNAIGVLNTYDAVKSFMSAPGVFIQTSSVAGLMNQGNPVAGRLAENPVNMQAYCTSKGTIRRFGSAMIDSNLKLITISPDSVMTDLVVASFLPALDLGPPPIAVSGTIDEMRTQFSAVNITRKIIVDAMQTVPSPSVLLKGVSMHPFFDSNLINIDEIKEFVSNGFSPGFQTYPIKFGYVAVKSLEVESNTELLFTQPVYNMGANKRLSKEMQDPFMMAVRMAGETPNAPMLLTEHEDLYSIPKSYKIVYV